MTRPLRTVGDLVSLQRGHDLTEGERKLGTVPVIGSAGHNGFHDVAKMKGPGVTIGRSGGSVGKVTFVVEDFWPHNTCIYVTDFKGNDPRFVAYLLGTLDLGQLNSGAAQPSLNRNFVYPVHVAYPKPVEQRRISDVLSAYEDLISNNQRRIALLEESARLLYCEWFVRLRFPGYEHTRIVDGVPKGWKSKKLGDVAHVNKTNLSGTFDGDIEYIDIASVTPGSINETTPYVFRDAPSRARRVVRHGDIIWSCVRPNRRSHAVVWRPPENLVASTGFAVISSIELPPSFLYQALTTDLFVGYLENHAKGAAYPAVVAGDFERAEVLVPPPALLTVFDEFAEPLLSQMHNLRSQNQKLRAARDLLLPRLMSGEIVV